MASLPEEKDHERNHACRQYGVGVDVNQWPIIYSAEYNIGFCGLEKLHPFDAGKWGHIFEFLKDAGMLRDNTVVEPMEASEEELRAVHTKQYISSLRWSINVASITEVPPVALLPNFIVQKKVLRPFRFQTSGTIMAGRLAMERGWAINIGGGFHHCSADRGGGFCAYADITLAVKFAFEKVERVSKVMIIDLDAHQGNGHERDFMHDSRVYILDVYNRGIYPHDGFAKRAIKRKVELGHFTADETYLGLVRMHVEGALNEFEPDLVVYNAGTDILEGDPLGNLSVTAQGIIERDQIVFQKCRTRNLPIFMVTSGGYLKETARIVADSILNLRNLRLISWDDAENAPLPECDVPRSGSDGGLFAKFRRLCISRSSTLSQNISALVSPKEERLSNSGSSVDDGVDRNYGAMKDTGDDAMKDTSNNAMKDTSNGAMKDTSNEAMKDTSNNAMKDTRNDAMKDTSNDTMKGTRNDAMKDTSNDTVKDTSNDTMKDTSNDTMKDTSNDAMKDTSNDTMKDTSNDAMKDTSNDTIKGTSNDTIKGTSNDAMKDTSNDIIKGTRNDAMKDTSNDAIKDVSNDAMKDTSNDAMKNTSNDTMKDTSNDTVKDTSNDAMKDTSNATVKDTSNDAMKDTSNDAMKYTSNDTMKDTSNDTVKDTSNDAMKDTSNDAMKDTSNDTIKDTSNDIMKDTSNDTVKDTSNDAMKDTSNDAMKDTSNDAMKDTSNDAMKDTSNNAMKNRSNETNRTINNQCMKSSNDRSNGDVKDKISSTSTDIGFIVDQNKDITIMSNRCIDVINEPDTYASHDRDNDIIDEESINLNKTKSIDVSCDIIDVSNDRSTDVSNE